MIKNIIFDIGYVLVYFRPDKAMEEIGIDRNRIPKLMEKTVYSKWWCELDRGVMDEQKVVRTMINDAPDYKSDIEKFFRESAEHIVEKFYYTDELIKSVKDKGFKIYLLSNYPRSFFEIHSEKQLDFVKCTDGKIVSAYVKLIKPDRRIYELLLDTYNLNPDECLFIDDRKENVDAANESGIHGIVFTGYEELITEINNIGGNNRC